MEEEQKRKEQWLPTKKKKTKKTISGFGELKKSVQRPKKKNSNQDKIKGRQAIAYLKIGKLKEAEDIYRELVKKGSRDHIVYGNLALLCIDNQREQIEYLRFALKLKPDYVNAHLNLGNALRETGDLFGAISSYQQALKYKHDFSEAQSNLGHVYLLVGQYQQGWLKHTFRFKKSQNPVTPYANPSIPEWQGEMVDLDEKLLVVAEQGLGDTIHFMRYIPYLRLQGFDIYFCAQPKLHNLIKASGITSKLLTQEQANGVKEGKWIPLLSIPKLLNVTPDNPVVTEPYVHASVEHVIKWKKILSKEKAPIIGINWQGEPKTEKTFLRGRSLPLEFFSTISQKNDCKFLSLQKGFGSDQLEVCSFKDRFVHCQDQVSNTWDFLETAAIIHNCDLIITSDTSVAHLAACMGKTTWCLLHYVPDWRWGMKGKTTFWYPSMRLFRQKEINNWADVLERVAIELKLLLSLENN